jgi:hypothetical protein
LSILGPVLGELLIFQKYQTVGTCCFHQAIIAENLLLIKPSTLLRFHNALKRRKYRNLYSPGGGGEPDPRGPSREVIPDNAGQALTAIVEMKGRDGVTPVETSGNAMVDINRYRWKQLCRGLFQLPVPA